MIVYGRGAMPLIRAGQSLCRFRFRTHWRAVAANLSANRAVCLVVADSPAGRQSRLHVLQGCLKAKKRRDFRPGLDELAKKWRDLAGISEHFAEDMY